MVALTFLKITGRPFSYASCIYGFSGMAFMSSVMWLITFANTDWLFYLIATLLLAIGQVRKSARESGISFKEYGMVNLLWFNCVHHLSHDNTFCNVVTISWSLLQKTRFTYQAPFY